MDKKNYRILVLDDDPDIGMMIKMMLEYKGHSVMLVERAEKGSRCYSR
jgi:DNA-binding response OmpR family regulator